ncbi:MAG: hypothetical protein FH752_14150 [Marinobacter adhaerens]|uniref:Uncharacterized protein n=1 Tax=Marinobacter adhaerens TaxID=1033846 RepID=A0A844I4A2_9GAMM|nr:hypothetical protein [Marinobacter adhaerens]
MSYENEEHDEVNGVLSFAGDDRKLGGQIFQSLNGYLSSVRAIGITAKIALPHIAKWAKNEIEEIQSEIEQYVSGEKGTEEGSISISFESAREFASFSRTLSKFDEIRSYNYLSVLSTSLFTQLFSEYDSFIGNLLKSIYLKNEDLFKGISREISLSDLLEYEDLRSVKISMLDKEIETFRRDSYIDQFISLENKFGFRTLRKFKEWPEFIELSQRRNILIHNGGKVSDQYLRVCEREGFKFVEKPKVGDYLGIDFEYFAKANRLLSKVGIMLSFTLWCKVFPKEYEQIHRALNDTIYNCLVQKRWHLVAELVDFSLSDSMRKEISEIALRVRTINSAIGLKFADNQDAANKILDSMDWTACYRDFKLAIAVLKDEYGEAIDIMKSIGKTGEIITQPDYHTWPLFTQFRQQPEFYEAYYEVYGEHFSERVSTEKGTVEAHPSHSSSSGKK